MWMSALRALQIVLTCVITSTVAITAAVQDRAIDYRVIILPVKVSLKVIIKNWINVSLALLPTYSSYAKHNMIVTWLCLHALFYHDYRY